MVLILNNLLGIGNKMIPFVTKDFLKNVKTFQIEQDRYYKQTLIKVINKSWWKFNKTYSFDWVRDENGDWAFPSYGRHFIEALTRELIERDSK